MNELGRRKGQRGRDLEVVFQGLIDRTRAALDLKTVTTIFGYKHRPNTLEQTHREPRLRVVTERPKSFTQ